MSEKTEEERKAKVIDLEEQRRKMRFTAQQRLTLLAMAPKDGGYFNIRKMRVVKEDLGLNDLEQKVFETATMLIPGGTITDWKQVNAKILLKAVDVGEWLANHFRTELKRQYDQEKLREDTVDLYDMFCGAPQD